MPRLAATVILLRGGSERLEVLLVKRNPSARFMGGAWVFVNVLKSLGKDGVTRANLMKAVRSLNIKACASPNTEGADKVLTTGSCDPWIFPGLTIHTSGDNQWPISQLALAHFNTASKNWSIDYSNVISAR